MALLANDLVNDAFGRAFPYVRETDIVYGPLLKHLTSLDMEVVQWYTFQSPERLNTQAPAITVVGSQNPTGYTLQPAGALGYSEFRWIDSQNFIWPINIVPEDRFDHPMLHPAGIVRGNTFFPADPIELRWSNNDPRQFYIGNGDTITYSYMPLVQPVTALTQNLVSPDEARNYIAASLTAQILLNAAEAVPQEKMQLAMAQMGARRQELMLEMMKRSEARARAMEQV
jgi:hypothetical protein